MMESVSVVVDGVIGGGGDDGDRGNGICVRRGE